ncbi:MAG: fused MFS/spermidine synthase, partial [Verrucomicrobia bacterium]|nr:fused MFS/spermidine synthase [Verrucomicrobiota bacterium]
KTAKPQTEPLAAPHRFIRVLLGLICFIAGAAIMVIEISANRLLAPNFGNSLYTWTALIGVILVAFSVGGYLGGVLADKMKRMDLLGWLLSGAAVLTMLIPFLNSMLAESLKDSGLISGPVIISLFLFALPGILLGAVSPASVRFYSLAGHDEHVGRAAGTISMLGSLGSFVGTFLSGFVLLSTFGVKTIFLGAGAILLLLALLAFWLARKSPRSQVAPLLVGLLAAASALPAEAVTDKAIKYHAQSFYHQIEVLQHDTPTGWDRRLKLDSTLEGGMMENGDLILDYQRFWQLAQLNDNLKIKRALFIGAGAFGMPEQVARIGVDVSVDVVEIDPAVIEVGRKFFKLDEFRNVRAHADDARRFLQRGSEKYDLVFGDAYNGVRHIPAHLITREFFTQVKSRLSDDGVFLMNVISAVEGERAALLGHTLATLRAVFPHVEVFAESVRHESQNVILLASVKSWKPWLEDRFYAANSWQVRLTGARVPPAYLPVPRQVLTDDWNPIDAVIARQLER